MINIGDFCLKIFSFFLEVKFSIYLNRLVFVMSSCIVCFMVMSLPRLMKWENWFYGPHFECSIIIINASYSLGKVTRTAVSQCFR